MMMMIQVKDLYIGAHAHDNNKSAKSDNNTTETRVMLLKD